MTVSGYLSQLFSKNKLRISVVQCRKHNFEGRVVCELKDFGMLILVSGVFV